MSQYNVYNNIAGSSDKIPVQTLTSKAKNEHWLKANMDFFYNDAVKQKRLNNVFSKIRKMTKGNFVYESVDISSTLTGADSEQLKKLTGSAPMPTHLKHFDFLGIAANAIESVFGELDDKYRVISIDEYFTNDFIRAKTQNFEKYITAFYDAEVNRLLIENGINPNKQDFKSEEEKQQYLQMLQAEVGKYTPEEFEKTLSKNFKVLATEWANNVLMRDKELFRLGSKDRERLIDYILTGRFFRHYKLGYDTYTIDEWAVEDVFFSRETHIKYPQEADYIGRLTTMSISKVISNFGHLMTTKQQEEIGNFFNQSTSYKKGDYPFNPTGVDGQLPFATNYILPFANYFDHQVNTQMEDYLGTPLGVTMNLDGSVQKDWMPRAGNLQQGLGNKFSREYRSDFVVSDSELDVMEVYWTSQQKTGILIYRNELGVLDIKQVSEDLMIDFIKENNIKVKRNTSPSEIRDALKTNTLEDYENTLHWHYLPQSWYAVVIKSNNSMLIKDDMILYGKPTEHQIRGNSNAYDILHPVGGIISDSEILKMFPYQQLHNVCLNQISELIADEPGIFYSFDINSIPDDLQDATTEETLFRMTDTIKLTKMLPVDLSRQKLQGGTAYPNIFQRNEIVFADLVKYRREMAEYFKQQAFSQLGITPQLLGQAMNQETAEGVKQMATATYALINNKIDDFNTARAMANELHVAIAQISEVFGNPSSKLTQNSDGINVFIDIMAEDGEYFPMRRISVLPPSDSKDRPIVKFLQNMLLSDNTIQKDFSDIVEIMTNPNSLKLRQIAREMAQKQDKKLQDQRAYESEQLDKKLLAEQQNLKEGRVHEIAIVDRKGEWQYKEAFLQALGRDSSSTSADNQKDLTNAFLANLKQTSVENDIQIKTADLERKITSDESSKQIEMERLRLAHKELEERQKKRISDETIAYVNKN